MARLFVPTFKSLAFVFNFESLYTAHMTRQALAGKRILITRARHQAPSVAKLIEEARAIPIALPCLALQQLPQNITTALNHIQNYSDVLFTSSNGVHAVAQACVQPLHEIFATQRVAAVGKKTAQALQTHGIAANIIPKTASQEGLIQAYQQSGLPQSLLFFRAADGSDILQTHLKKQGVHVTLVKAYQSICPQDEADDALNLLVAHRIDAVLLASPKTAAHYLQRVNNLELANTPVIVVISQQVADAADKLGLKVQLIAKHASFPSMLDALADYFSSRSH